MVAAQPRSTSSATEVPRNTPLHYDIEEFCKEVVPTNREKAERLAVIEAVKVSVRKAISDNQGRLGSRRVNVELFGSFVSGLSTWSSDIDVVITGLIEPNFYTGKFSKGDKYNVGQWLDRMAIELRKNRQLRLEGRVEIIRNARVPLVKIKARGNITVDISLGNSSGPKAARYVRHQVALYPQLRPLVLVLKAYLRTLQLNEVMSGGLSSWSLTNMVIAHLQEELRVERDVYDLGELLYGFLVRYGDEFDYSNEAVSVASGGIVSKTTLGHVGEWRTPGWQEGYEEDVVPVEDRLVVDDPLTGRDVSTGSYRIDQIQRAFARAARRLEQLAASRAQRPNARAVNYLSALFDLQKVLERPYVETDEEEGSEDGDAVFGSLDEESAKQYYSETYDAEQLEDLMESSWEEQQRAGGDDRDLGLQQDGGYLQARLR